MPINRRREQGRRHGGEENKEVKRRDLGPKGERVRYLKEGRKLEMVFGRGLGKEPVERAGGKRAIQLSWGKTILFASSSTPPRPR